ncbi:DUF4351 domain-containing protein [Leptolyngbya sp. FACHB-671]|nr:DUF4351 domain-containing protein [Leptolyngbya sp. FACHB-671]MBD2066726.1 DUF4351 domain-containing protein [Leptolyngbya sp. FACHB-671]
MIDHDRLFKELLSTFFVEFIDLFLPEVSAYLEPNSLTFLNTEVFTDVTEGDRHEADLLVQANFRGEDSCFLIHTEHQSYAESNFGQRMFNYFARLYQKYRLPIYPIVVFSFDEPYRAEGDRFEVTFPNKLVLQFNYEVIQLNRLNRRDFVRQPNPVASALMAKMRIPQAERPKVKLECLRLLATLRLDPARMQLISGFIDVYLRLNPSEQQQFQNELDRINPRQQREEVMEIVTSWMQEGIERGLEQGLEQGRQEGEIAVISRLLSRKFGAVDAELQERLRQLSIAQLEDLAEALLDFSTKADLMDWLNRRS